MIPKEYQDETDYRKILESFSIQIFPRTRHGKMGAVCHIARTIRVDSTIYYRSK